MSAQLTRNQLAIAKFLFFLRHSIYIEKWVKNGNKTESIKMLKNFHRNLTTVVRAENDTSKTENITYTIFNRKRR